ncbi:hypothetical protein KP509_11G030000 [Ceratopteris richardii]|uniref:Large ribosomal subunit protein bL34m n=2 Tax=Ceratopteris richardii TaxID=49495 RepID=A0A8T2TT25_CERRI|nr:hypothetical protein KP509_11G030000 [Ceratopteris richardii]
MYQVHVFGENLIICCISKSSPMLMNTKRTFNPSTLVRKRRHGFLARKSTVGGRRVLARRFLKGRRRLSA